MITRTEVGIFVSYRGLNEKQHKRLKAHKTEAIKIY